MSWRDGLTIKEIADQLGYTYRCRGCGQVCDGPWCGCDAGAPEDEAEPEEPVCAWCGDPLVTAGSLPTDKILRDGNDLYHDYCAEEAAYAEVGKLDHAWR